jgi:hypothetical protein
MPSLSHHTLQKAIYDKLIASTGLMSLVSGIFDHVPQNTVFPYVVIRNIASSDLSNLAKSGVETSVIINIWSREAGNKQTANIMEIIYGLLHDGSLVMSGKNVFAVRIVKTSIELENDGWTYQGIMELRAVIIDN